MDFETNLAGDIPQVARTAVVHPTAILIGRIIVGEHVFIGPNAILRADEPGPDGEVSPIVIGDEVNVQDAVIMHALGGTGIEIGNRSSIAHGAVVHGPCWIGEGCFIGFNSIVFRATLGDGVVVLHQAVVENVDIPSGMSVPSARAISTAADVEGLKPATPDLSRFAQGVHRMNVSLVRGALRRQCTCQHS